MESTSFIPMSKFIQDVRNDIEKLEGEIEVDKRALLSSSENTPKFIIEELSNSLKDLRDRLKKREDILMQYSILNVSTIPSFGFGSPFPSTVAPESKTVNRPKTMKVWKFLIFYNYYR